MSTHPYAQDTVGTADSIILAYSSNDDTLVSLLDSLTATEAQDVITAILLRTVAKDPTPTNTGLSVTVSTLTPSAKSA